MMPKSIKRITSVLVAFMIFVLGFSSPIYAESISSKPQETNNNPISVDDGELYAVYFDGILHYFANNEDKQQFIKDNSSQSRQTRAGNYKSFLVDSEDSVPLAWVGCFPPYDTYNFASSYTLQYQNTYSTSISLSYYGIGLSYTVTKSMTSSIKYDANSSYANKLGVWSGYQKQRWKHVTYNEMGYAVNTYYSVSVVHKGDTYIGACYKDINRKCGVAL